MGDQRIEFRGLRDGDSGAESGAGDAGCAVECSGGKVLGLFFSGEGIVDKARESRGGKF